MAQRKNWAEDPIWNAYIKCTVGMLESLKPATPLLECAVRILPGGRAVEKFRFLGHVVSLKKQERKTEFTIDDGTGMIFCTWWSEADWFRSKPFINRQSPPPTHAFHGSISRRKTENDPCIISYLFLTEELTE